MRFLLDMPVSPSLIAVLESHEHEAVHAYRIGKGEASDTELMDLARVEERVIITADLDFPRLLALARTRRPGLILFRGGNYSDAEMRGLLERVLTQVPAKRLSNSICVVDRKRIRITQLPIGR
jgi:predicted nuclease of predicted toxin-antitoxin system